jgi:TonB family protein
VSQTKEHASVLETPVLSETREAVVPAEPAAEPREDDELAAFIGRLMFEAPETEPAQTTRRRSPFIVLIAAQLLLGAFAGGGLYWWRSRPHETVAKPSTKATNVAAPVNALPPANTLTASTGSSPLAGTSNLVEASSAPSAPGVKLTENRETPNAGSKMPTAISRFRLSKPYAKHTPSTSSTAANAEAAGIDSAPNVPSSVPVEGFSTLISKPGLQPAAPTPERAVGGEVKVARLISSASPAYPSLARSQRVEGDVSLDALIDETGRVTKIKVISGPQLLQEAAAAAVRQWKYEPALLDGKAVPIHLTVTVKFQLR